jgi:Predicted periplasmic or secreted lipoprotein
MTDDDLRRDVAAELYWDPRVGSRRSRYRPPAAWSRCAGPWLACGTSERGATPPPASAGSPGSPMTDGCSSRTGTGVTTRTCAATSGSADAGGLGADDRRCAGPGRLVTLTGTVQWHYQREAAESRTASVPGVTGIGNAIALAEAPDARAAADAISCAFRRDAVLDAGRLRSRPFRRAGDLVRHGQVLGRARSRSGRRLVRGWGHRRR